MKYKKIILKSMALALTVIIINLSLNIYLSYSELYFPKDNQNIFKGYTVLARSQTLDSDARSSKESLSAETQSFNIDKTLQEKRILIQLLLLLIIFVVLASLYNIVFKILTRREGKTTSPLLALYREGGK